MTTPAKCHDTHCLNSADIRVSDVTAYCARHAKPLLPEWVRW